MILHIKGITAQALLIASAYPCSRNTALYALEYNHHPEYAAQAVFLSTLLSPVTVASVIGIAHVYFNPHAKGAHRLWFFWHTFVL